MPDPAMMSRRWVVSVITDDTDFSAL